MHDHTASGAGLKTNLTGIWSLTKTAPWRIEVPVVAKSCVPGVAVDDSPLDPTLGIHAKRGTTTDGEGVTWDWLSLWTARVRRCAAHVEHRECHQGGRNAQASLHV